MNTEDIFYIQSSINYYYIYKKLPEINDNDLFVRSLGIFLNTQKYKYVMNLLNYEEYILLCKIPTFEYVLNFTKKTKLLNDYYNLYQILPQHYNTSNIAIILTKFLNEQRKKCYLGTLSENEYNMLNIIPTVCNRLNKSDNVFINMLSFEDKIKYIINYYNDVGKLPSCKSKNTIIRTLGYFLYYHRKHSINKPNLYKLLCNIPTFKHKVTK